MGPHWNELAHKTSFEFTWGSRCMQIKAVSCITTSLLCSEVERHWRKLFIYCPRFKYLMNYHRFILSVTTVSFFLPQYSRHSDTRWNVSWQREKVSSALWPVCRLFKVRDFECQPYPTIRRNVCQEATLIATGTLAWNTSDGADGLAFNCRKKIRDWALIINGKGFIMWSSGLCLTSV